MTEPLCRARRLLWPAVLIVAVAAGCPRGSDPPPPAAPPPPPADFDKQVNQFCTHCHEYPPADTFPRSAWKEEVEQAYRFFKESPLAGTMQPPPREQVVKYYEDNAPRELPLPVLARAAGPLPVSFQPAACPAPPQAPA